MTCGRTRARPQRFTSIHILFCRFQQLCGFSSEKKTKKQDENKDFNVTFSPREVWFSTVGRFHKDIKVNFSFGSCSSFCIMCKSAHFSSLFVCTNTVWCGKSEWKETLTEKIHQNESVTHSSSAEFAIVVSLGRSSAQTNRGNSNVFEASATAKSGFLEFPEKSGQNTTSLTLHTAFSCTYTTSHCLQLLLLPLVTAKQNNEHLKIPTVAASVSLNLQLRWNLTLNQTQKVCMKWGVHRQQT